MPKKKPPVESPPTPKGKRILVKRQVSPVAGAGNIIVVKSGEEIRAGLIPRYQAMEKDAQTVDFYWNRLVVDPNYNETKEYPLHTNIINKWMVQENVKVLPEFKARMTRLKILIDHFQPGHDYELSVDELVGILT